MTQQIQDLIAAARPGTRIRIIEIEVPGEPNPEGFALLRATEDAQVNAAVCAEPGQGYSEKEQRLSQLLHLANGPLKLAEWSKLIAGAWMHTISERELERAVAAEVLTGSIKGEGKDHKATVVGPESMARYLTLCDAVQQGSEPRPPWWAAVRKGMNAYIDRAA